jgi:hypothetical protein
LVDHIIIGDKLYVSLREKGLFWNKVIGRMPKRKEIYV